MARYRMDNGAIVDTDNANKVWEEDTIWNGNNHIGKATGSQWEHQTLYKSRKGRYYIEYESDWEGSHPHVEWVSREKAARWLLLMNEELPEDLNDLKESILE